MIVRDATAADIERVVPAMREKDAFEVYSDRFDKSPQALIVDLVVARQRAIALLSLADDDGAAIAILGALLVAPARAEVMMIATAEWSKIATSATRFVLRKFIPAYLGGVRSSECRCWEGNIVSRRWLERLGYACVATLPQHDAVGSTFLLYRRVNPRYSAPVTHRVRARM